MGILDIFKKKENKQKIQPEMNGTPEMKQLPFEINYSSTSKGDLQVEFYNRQADFKDFYDITRLIVGRQPLNMAGEQVYNCAVSWYGQSDLQMLDKKTGKIESLRANNYRGVWAEINIQSLLNDPNYCKIVMEELLNKKRVESYLERGLEEEPENPCGKYIGGVRKINNGYGKFFSPEVGRVAHNSELMIGRRKERREALEAKRQRDIAEKKAQVEKLKNEIREME